MSVTYKEQANETTKKFVFASGLAGGIAGVTVDFVVFPIEAIKTQIQASNKKINFQEMAAKNSKYKGFSAQFISAFPFAFLYFFVYEEGKRILRNSVDFNLNIQHMIAAGFAEAIGNAFRSPFEVVKQQQQVGWDNKISQTIKTIYGLNGIKGFYAGFSTLLMRDIPYSVIQYPLYDKMRQIEQRNRRKRENLPEDAQVSLSLYESSKCGAVAAAVASFLTTPLDVIKTKLMTQRDGYYKGALDAFRKTVLEEGYMALFKGVKHRVLPLSFTGTIYFTVYEQARNTINKHILH